MTLHTVQDPEGPEQPPGETPVSFALRAIGKLLSESRLAHEQFQEARHDQAEAQRLDGEAAVARKKTSDAEARAIAERHKASPHKRLNRRLGAGLAVLLALLDAVPAYWAAQAFGLDQNSTYVLTVLLCAALGGAMWLLDLFAEKGRTSARRVLQVALGAGFAALFVLRLDYLQVTGAEDFWQAAVQAFVLTGLSAALVTVGFVLLSHRVPKAVTDAERAARQAAGEPATQAAEDAQRKADMSRAALEDTVVTWVLAHEPAGIGHQQLLQAVEEAVGILLHR